MSQNNTLTHGKLQRCQTQRRNTQITAEIMQTYDLLKFALARSNGSSFLLILVIVITKAAPAFFYSC